MVKNSSYIYLEELRFDDRELFKAKITKFFYWKIQFSCVCFLFSATNFFQIGFINFVFFLCGKQNLNSEIRKNILAKPFPKDIEEDHALNLMHSTDFLMS